jgi:hypothetical protein
MMSRSSRGKVDPGSLSELSDAPAWSTRRLRPAPDNACGSAWYGSRVLSYVQESRYELLESGAAVVTVVAMVDHYIS